MSLDRDAQEIAIPGDVKRRIIKDLWPWSTSIVPDTALPTWDAYFQYYSSECRDWIMYGNGEYTFVKKHKDVTAIARMFKDDKTKSEIISSLLPWDTQNRTDAIKKRMAEGAIRLTARLTTMVDIGTIPQFAQGMEHLEHPWNDEATKLKAHLTGYFGEQTTDTEKSRFGADITAYNIQRYTGIRIRWTNNLADHLRLVDDDTKLCIFHHLTYLNRHLNSPILPTDLAKETILTLALLFPRYDKDPEKWLRAQISSNKSEIVIDPELLRCDRVMPSDRALDKFKFWRDELLTLKEKFDKPRPTSILQFWHDRRKKVQWFTFWIAVWVLLLTVFFGLVQSIEGAIQVYKAYHPTAS
ncbi:hypothetical protein K491DRAFT_656664 [Lophiostoma macrostomum CBS 122681]|uniref:Uncharacterized protein n=1 Tax=Lophiostoma macrostomum CBS 122681 TaxID=1314788 RepID=A0A6A6TBT3_9PLEO|nr:hypothetical protein K491DRAFT_656664 [Lophiostoma macrostomum CBS 122681]